MAIITSIRALFNPVKSIASGSVSNIYSMIGTPFERPVRVIILQNYTNGPVMFSFDGVDDHVPLAASGYMIIDVTGNRTNTGDGWYIGEGTTVYVKYLTGAVSGGSVFVSSIYGGN
jgi:hypothetical protein